MSDDISCAFFAVQGGVQRRSYTLTDMKEETAKGRQPDFDYDDDLLMDDEINIDFGKYWRRLKAHWNPVLWITAAGFVLGCLIALDTPHKYVATSRLAPELSSTATNRLSSVASLVGFSASVLGSTDAVYPMVYPDIVHSPEFIAELFNTPVTYRSRKGERKVTIYEYMDSLGKKSIVGMVRALPGMAIDGMKSIFTNDAEEESDSLVVDPFHFTKSQGVIYKALSKSIAAEIDKKTLIVTISVTMDDNLIAAEMARAVNDKLQEYVLRYRTEKAQMDCDYYEKMYLKAEEEYRASQRVYARYADSHQGIISQSARIESERLRDEMNLKYQLYTSMAQQLQSAEAKVQQETPVFAEVITPTVPLRSSNSRKKIALAFAFLAFCGGVVWVVSWYKETDEIVDNG